MLQDYAYVAGFLLVGVLFVGLAFVFSKILRPHHPNPTKTSTYECGEPAFGSAWVQYNVKYYIFAIAFVVFDVETVFLFPWAVAFKELGIIGFLEMGIFIGILILGLAYAWKKKFLKWI